MTQAEELFETERAHLIIQEQMENILPEGWEDYNYDYYDYSVEIYNIHRDLTPEELKRLRDFRFEVVWTHARSIGTPRDTGPERYYRLWDMENL